MGRIAILDQNMINMIAAGEVIERPASVVKELMENSIDAGATQISVSIEDGGRKLIAVTDNGFGMDSEDLARAFQPHATSKIKTDTDLLGISTLGFRGEALASIASIARVRAVSRTGESVAAHCIEIDCGQTTTDSPYSGDIGTTIEVRDIFYKLPARRKFLRTANTELSHITEQFTRIALGSQTPAQTSVTATQTPSLSIPLDLTLTHNNRELYRLSKTQTIAQRIGSLFPQLSNDVDTDFIQAQSSERGLKISALLGKPGLSRTSSKFQYTFLNGRFIRDKFISHAVREAYRGMIEPNRFPVVFLFIEMPCEDYDVNVHPTKTEVRFYNSNLVHSQILGCLRETLLGTDMNVQAKLPTATDSLRLGSTTAPSERTGRIAEAMADFFKKHRPQTQPPLNFEPRPHKEHPENDIPTARPAFEEPPGSKPVQLQHKFLQVHDSFIVAQTDDGFIIVDQHALHERILYQNLRKRIQSGKLESQRLLIPASFELSGPQAHLLAENTELLEKLGIELVPFGPDTMAVQAFPTLLEKADPIEVIQDLTDLLDHQASTRDAEALLDEVLNMAACKAAIKAGKKLTAEEIEHLLAQIPITECAGRCPHGRPTTLKFTLSDLEKQFKRT